ncbi:hypothetical protein QLX08_002379 [Tetragonisca angustula]|uniref:Uncharacterized protein n=1 Tax=Tetragonisca angustula TaxID=166442 RepID=A0AAW1ABL2_9HYME
MVEMVEEQQHGAGGGREEEEGKRGNTRIVMHNGALARSRRSDGLSRGPVGNSTDRYFINEQIQHQVESNIRNRSTLRGS